MRPGLFDRSSAADALRLAGWVIPSWTTACLPACLCETLPTRLLGQRGSFGNSADSDVKECYTFAKALHNVAHTVVNPCMFLWTDDMRRCMRSGSKYKLGGHESDLSEKPSSGQAVAFRKEGKEGAQRSTNDDQHRRDRSVHSHVHK